MQISEYWHLCQELSVIQAALLIIGEDPERWQRQICELPFEDRPKGYEATMAALTTDIHAGRLPAKIVMADDEFARDTPPDLSIRIQP